MYPILSKLRKFSLVSSGKILLLAEPSMEVSKVTACGISDPVFYINIRTCMCVCVYLCGEINLAVDSALGYENFCQGCS